MTNQTTATLADPTGTPANPQHTFMCSREVFLRYRWKRTKGYQMLTSPGFPRPIGGRYRLDTLIAWESRVLAGDLEQEPTPAAAVAPVLSAAPLEDSLELPRRNRTRGVTRKNAA
jgi:hypothetical protein